MVILHETNMAKYWGANMSNKYGIRTEKTLNHLNIIDISELDGMSLSKFIENYPNEKIEKSFIAEMNQWGYLYPKEGDICLSDIQMTTRLRNILARNGIYFISQLGNYSKESYMKMRNLGEVAFQELQEVCVRYKVELSTVKLLEEDLQPVKFSTSQVLILYESGINLAKDFEGYTMEELQEKYGYDKRLYSGICKVIEEKGLRLRRRGKVARIIF